jgi:hypothetical protein
MENKVDSLINKKYGLGIYINTSEIEAGVYIFLQVHRLVKYLNI